MHPSQAAPVMTDAVKRVLRHYDGERPGIKANLARLMMHGRPAGSGKLVILPVDQGFEHGPGRSFAVNPPAYDPHYVFQLAIDAGLSALAAPYGLLSAGADHFAGQVPLILKANDADNLNPEKDQAITGTVHDALELGCSAIGYTIYPGADRQYEMFEEVRQGAAEARAHGLAVVIWAYPRGGELTKDDETALDVIAHGAQIAAQLGAHIIKCKLPSDHVHTPEARAAYDASDTDFSLLRNRVTHVVQSAFAGRRLVIFSGGAAKKTDEIYEEIRAIRAGGGHGSIIGRNSFQRPWHEALELLNTVIDIHTEAPAA